MTAVGKCHPPIPISAPSFQHPPPSNPQFTLRVNTGWESQSFQSQEDARLLARTAIIHLQDKWGREIAAASLSQTTP